MIPHRAAALCGAVIGVLLSASVAQYSYDASQYVYEDGNEYRNLYDGLAKQYDDEYDAYDDYYEYQDYTPRPSHSNARIRHSNARTGYSSGRTGYSSGRTGSTSRTGLRSRGQGERRNYRYYNNPSMVHYQKSTGYHQPKKEFVPVVIKKKKQKKKKILTTHHGFFIRGGTAVFGKFKDLHSCEKACEITPTCFAGDYNPWLGKCFLHSNLTACASLSSHKAITHFKKVPCQVTETPRGTVVLGANTLFGIEIKGIDTLQDCIKKCVTAGGGIASADDKVVDTPQICCNIDYDFATHKCFMHPCINELETNRFCVGDNIEAPVNSVANPSTITITFCPLMDLTP